MVSLVCHVDEIRTLAFGAINGLTYTALGGDFDHPMRMIKITNNTDGDMLFSFDGVTNNLFIPAGGFTLHDVTTNRENNGVYFVFNSGTQVFVKYNTAPTSGDVWLECLYGQGE